jgi:hypothetical protein
MAPGHVIAKSMEEFLELKVKAIYPPVSQTPIRQIIMAPYYPVWRARRELIMQ